MPIVMVLVMASLGVSASLNFGLGTSFLPATVYVPLFLFKKSPPAPPGSSGALPQPHSSSRIV